MPARLAIVVFAVAKALGQMGIADDVVNLTFGLVLTAVALAVVLAFGLGGTDVAKFQLVRWYRRAEKSLAEVEAKEAAESLWLTCRTPTYPTRRSRLSRRAGRDSLSGLLE